MAATDHAPHLSQLAGQAGDGKQATHLVVVQV